MDIQALAFYTGGTVLDWHTGRVRAFQQVGARHAAVANDWRERTMAAIVGQVRPAFHLGDMHRRVLDDTLAHFEIAARWTNLEPQQVMMVACHNFNLQAAHQTGMRTAFVRWADEWCPHDPPNPQPNRACDFIVDRFDGLRQAVLARCPDR